MPRLFLWGIQTFRCGISFVNFGARTSNLLSNIVEKTPAYVARAKIHYRSVPAQFLKRPIAVAALIALPFACKHVSCKHKSPQSRRVQPIHSSVGSATSLTFKELWSLIRPYFGWLLCAIASAIGVAVLNIQLPLALGDLVNVIAQIKDFSHLSHLKPVALRIALLYGAQAALTALYITFLTVLGERMAVDLRLKLFNSLLNQDIAFFDANRTGEIVSRLSSDVQEFKSAFKLCVSQGLRSATQTAGCVVSLYLISPKMTLITVSVVPAIIIGGSVLGSGLRALSRAAQQQVARATAVAEEALANIRTVRSFAMEHTELELYDKELSHSRRLNEYLGIGIGVFQGLANLALNGIVLGVLYGGSQMIQTDEMSPGQLMSFLVTAQTIQRSLAQVSVLFGQAVKGWTAGGRVFEYINYPCCIPSRGHKTIPFHSLMGSVEYKGVKFAYPTRPAHTVLDGLDLSLKTGTITALCGPSGEGKSTIAALLERFYDVQCGSITVDGVDIRKLDPKWLRGRVIGFISQEPVLFATSILENIRYGKPEASFEEVEKAAKLANAHDFIRFFKDGYLTSVGERGVQLSGGQKQRIAIARALLKDPTILVMDEATSALDNESERLVRDALEKASKGRTVLIIAHRLSTIQHADQIAVIKGGKVAEIGTHDQLIEKKGFYQKIVEMIADGS